MRLPFLALPLLVMAVPASAAAPQPTGTMPIVKPGKKADCPKTSAYMALKRGKPLAAQKLADLPPANLYLPVYRRIDGCEVPIVAGYGIGATGKNKPGR